MEMPQTSSSLEDDDVKEIERQLMTDIEAIMAGKRIDEATGEITSAPLGAEYILPKIRGRRKYESFHDEDDDDDDDEPSERNVRVIRPRNRRDRIIVRNFMRGCRANPYPERGSVINIKLSQSVDKVTMEGGQCKKLIIEKHIQLDYGTGEWAHIKIYRDLNGMVVPVPMLESQTNDDN